MTLKNIDNNYHFYFKNKKENSQINQKKSLTLFLKYFILNQSKDGTVLKYKNFLDLMKIDLPGNKSHKKISIIHKKPSPTVPSSTAETL
jgi:hypothetical protein